MLKTGIISDAYFTFDTYQEGMPLMKKHGYDGFDYQGFGSFKNSPLYQMNDEELKRYLTELKDCASANGLEIYQLHGTWPHVDDTTEEGIEKTIAYFKKNIVGAKMLGCPRVIIHPLMPNLFTGEPFDEEKDFAINEHVLRSLAPVARENGVTVCLENMPFPQTCAFSYLKNIKKLVSKIDDEYIKVCLDTGHFNSVKGDIYEEICLLGEHLAALHVHDDRHGQDRHLIPFMGETDWAGFVKALKEISFQGVISLETTIWPGVPEPMRTQMQVALSGIAKWFAEQISG